MKQPELLDASTVEGLKEVVSDFPWFVAARMLYLRNLRNINSYRFEAELSKQAVFISDRQQLLKLLSGTGQEEREFQLLPFNNDLLGTLLSETRPDPLSEFQLEPTSAFKLEPEDKNESTQPLDLIDKFINENPTIIPRKTTPVPSKKLLDEEKEEVEEGLITETLAGIYVQQGLYGEALKAYEKLSLKFPEKNTYFASQIEKIKNLISKDS